MKVSDRLQEEREHVEEFLSSPAQKWASIQTQLDKGIQKGMHAADRNYASQLSQEERNEIYAIAIEKSFKGLIEGKWGGKSFLQNWSYRIGYHATVDILRQRNRNPLYLAKALERDNGTEPLHQHHVNETRRVDSPHVAEPIETPEDSLLKQNKHQRISRLREVVSSWSEPEKTMGLAILNGDAKSLTAAAHIVARRGHKMYLAKARALLRSRLKEFEDLV